MKVILKNSSMVFKTKSIVAGEYPTKNVCLVENGYYKMVSNTPEKMEPYYDRGSSDFIPVDRIESITVACTKNVTGISLIPGVLYFSSKNINSYMSCQYCTSGTTIDLLETFTPPVGANYCILQSFVDSTHLPNDATIEFN